MPEARWQASASEVNSTAELSIYWEAERVLKGFLVAGSDLIQRSVLCQINEDKEARRRERARLLLAGHSLSEEEDPFDGLTPEVQQAAHAYVVWLQARQ